MASSSGCATPPVGLLHLTQRKFGVTLFIGAAIFGSGPEANIRIENGSLEKTHFVIEVKPTNYDEDGCQHPISRIWRCGTAETVVLREGDEEVSVGNTPVELLPGDVIFAGKISMKIHVPLNEPSSDNIIMPTEATVWHQVVPLTK